MIRHRYLIPLVFAFIAFGLAVYGYSRRTAKVLLKDSARLSTGEHLAFPPVELNKDRHYKLLVGSERSLPLGRTAAITVSLTGEDDSEVFTLEDSYWHQRGRWNEGGESGTWEERNRLTEFDFLVPVSGEYELRLDVVATDIPGLSLGTRIEESQPFAFAEWPFLVAGFVLLALALWVWIGRGKLCAEYVKSMGVGTQLKVGDVEFEVLRRLQYHENGDVGGVEFVLTSPGGHTPSRYLSVEEYEREWEDSEGDDQTAIHRNIYLDVVLTQMELDSLPNELPPYVHLRGIGYTHDPDNSGWGYVEDGSGGKRRFQASMFRDSLSFPKKPGQMWLERLEYGDDEEVEWSLQEIVDWKKIEITKAIPA